MKIGFIGLGNVGAKLAGSLLRNGHDLTVRDLDRTAARPILAQGAKWAGSPAEIAANCDLIITCLPSPAACAEVMEATATASSQASVPARSGPRCRPPTRPR